MSLMSLEKRRLILASTSVLKALGHNGLDRMLLEMGVPEDVGAGSGLLSRSTSLGRYLLSNPDVLDLRGQSISDAVISRARNLVERGVTTNLSQDDLDEFGAALEASATVDTRQSTPVPIPQPAFAQPPPSWQAKAMPATARPKPRRKVFVVHGHDEAPREKVARLLEHLNFEPVILHERANRGRTIITKFQEEAADVGFAVVLMTPDDLGGKAGEEPRARPRQNVVFELGFFVGILGPERVAALVRGDLEKPSDFDGVMYISMDDGDGWRIALGRELQAAGFDVDFGKLSQGAAVPTRSQNNAFSEGRRTGTLKLGQRVFHAKFGFGAVVEIQDNKIEVNFEHAGLKRVLDSFLTPA